MEVSYFCRTISSSLRLFPLILCVLLAITTGVNAQVDSIARTRTAKLQQQISDLGMTDMKLILASMNDQARFPAYYINNVEGVKYYKERLKRSPNDTHLVFDLALQYLYSGETAKAIELFESLYNNEASGISRSLLLNYMAISYFRLGEQQNCIANHNDQSCIIPFTDKAFHINKDPATHAIELYTQILQQNPGNYNARWMINLAYMALDRYPDDVPRPYLVDLNLYCYDNDLQPFVNIAGPLKVGVNTYYGGTSVEDFNNDFLPDIFVTSGNPKDNVHYFVNNGNGSFTDMTKAAGLQGITGGCNVIHADYNNDGFTDLYIMRDGWMLQNEYPPYPNSLLKNNGDGTFTDVTITSGLLEFHPSHTAAFADIDNDCHLDLFVGNESDSLRKHPCSFYHNNGDGTFTKMDVGLDVVGFVKGCAWDDVNNDGYPDLYISVYRGKNKLMLNKPGATEGSRRFEDVAEAWGVTGPVGSFPLFFADINNDGLTDLFVDSYDANGDRGGVDLASEYLGQKQCENPPAVYIHARGDSFMNKTTSYGLNRTLYSMGLNVGDINCDGFPDFYCGTGNPSYDALYPNLMFRNVNGEYFDDVTCNTHTGHLQKTHGIAFADFDMDGDEDMYVNLGGFLEGDFFANALFLNPGNDNNWISLKLEGVISNRSAIGAKIHVIASGPEGERHIYRTVSTGGSYGSSPLQQHIGLGTADKIEKVIITWPSSGIVQEFDKLKINNVYLINEKERKPDKIKVKPFSLLGAVQQLNMMPAGMHEHHH